MSQDTDSSIWLKNLMAAHLGGGTPVLKNPRVEASTPGQIGQDSYEHIIRFSYPSALPPSAECVSWADIPISPTDDFANEKRLDDEERMVEGDNKDAYPSIPILVTLTVALMIAIFMIGLDTNIIGGLPMFQCFCSRRVGAVWSCVKRRSS